jgi:Methyltransferase domain
MTKGARRPSEEGVLSVAKPVVALHAAEHVDRPLSLLAYAALSYSGFRREHSFRTRLRSDGTVVDGTNGAEVLLWATHVAPSLLGRPATSADLAPILEISRRIVRQLTSTFSDEEIAAGRTGGYPSLKEAILYLLVRLRRPRLVVETGVAQGISSTFILEAMEANGEGALVSVDRPNYDMAGGAIAETTAKVKAALKPGFEPGWLIPAALRPRWTLLLGDARRILPTIDRGSPEIFLHDSLHTFEHMMFEMEWAYARQHPGDYIVADNIPLNGSFDAFLAAHPATMRPIIDRKVGVAFRRAA